MHTQNWGFSQSPLIHDSTGQGNARTLLMSIVRKAIQKDTPGLGCQSKNQCLSNVAWENRQVFIGTLLSSNMVV